MRAILLTLLCIGTTGTALAVTKKGAKVLDFQDSSREEKSLPEGCGNPYAEAIRFREFFDNTLAYMAARRGANSKGIVDLYGVSAIRDEISALFPNYTEESPVDRLIMAQLCQFQKISAQSLNLDDKKPLVITAADGNLHDHLVIVAAKMYADAKALLLESVADQKKKEKEDASLRMRYAEILRAREKSRNRVRELLN